MEGNGWGSRDISLACLSRVLWISHLVTKINKMLLKYRAMGIFFLSQFVLGMLGNSVFFLSCFIIDGFSVITARFTDLIFKHLAGANFMVVFCKGMPQTMAAFG